MSYQDIITIQAGKRGGVPPSATHQEILSDYPERTEADIRACLAYAVSADWTEN